MSFAAKWDAAHEAMLREVYPGHGASEALCGRLGRTVAAVSARAKLLKIKRSSRQRFNYRDVPIPVLDESRLTPQAAEPDGDEARRSRARQLAADIAHGVDRFGLRDAGWTEAAALAVMADCPEWIAHDGWTWSVTDAGRAALLATPDVHHLGRHNDAAAAAGPRVSRGIITVPRGLGLTRRTVG